MKKKTSKIVNSLMGFYQLACGLFESLAVIPDDTLKGLILKEHLFQLLMYHKEFTDKYTVGVPVVDAFYKTYCDEYTVKMKALTKKFTNIIDKHLKKNEGVEYIS